MDARFPPPQAALDNVDCTRKKAAIDDALYVLQGKWTLPVIVALHSGHERFGAIRSAVGNIAPKVLSNELKLLEMNGFVQRNVAPDAPTDVTYRATDYSHTLHKVIAALMEWGLMHRDTLRRAAALEVGQQRA